MQSAAAMLLPLLLLLALAVPLQARSTIDGFVVMEPFPDDMLEEHIVVFGVAGGVVGCSFIVALVLAIAGSSIRLPGMIALVVWSGVVLVALLTWHLTYVEARDEIHAKSTLLLLRTGTTLQQVEEDFSIGYKLAVAMARATRDGTNPDIHGFFPRHHLYLAGLFDAIVANTSSVLMLLWARRDGTFFSVRPIAPGHYAMHQGFEPDTPLPAFGCPAHYDYLEGGACETRKEQMLCGTNATLDAECPAACELPPAPEYCVPKRAADPSEQKPNTVTLRAHYAPDTGLTFDESRPTTRSSYDPRLRPWFISDDRVVWSAPYPFYGSGVGITVVRGVYDPAGRWIGALGVDYTLRTLRQTVQRLVPTENALLFLMTLKQEVLGSSFSEEALAADVHPHDPDGAVLVISQITNPESRLRRATSHVLSVFGTMEETARAGPILLNRGGRVIVGFPLHVPGDLDILAIAELPHDDLLGAANEASTRALLTAVGLAVGLSLLIYAAVTLLLRPLQLLARDMDLVAWLKLEALTSHSTSRIHEIAWMQQSFRKMVENLTEYRQYIPQSMLEEDDDELGASLDLQSQSTAIVFTDIVGSTQCWEATAQGMRAALRVHNTVIRNLIETHGGYEVKVIGDSFMVAFPSAESAVAFSLAVQVELNMSTWPEELLACEQCAVTPDGNWAGLRLRIGVNYGLADVEFNQVTGRKDYFGSTVNKAARLEGCCAPGAVAVTEEVIAALGPSTDFIALPMGKARLKGLGSVSTVLLLPEKLRGRQGTVEAAWRIIASRTRNMTPSDGSHHDVRSMSSDPDSISVGGERKKDRFKEHLQRANSATVMKVDLTFRESLVDSFEDPSSQVNEGFHATLAAVQGMQGAVLSVVGAAVFVGWNVRKSAPHHIQQAVQCAGLLRENVNRLASAILSIGISTGPALHGNVGRGGQRFVTVIGPCVTMASALAGAALRFGTTCLYTALNGSPLFALSNPQSIRPVDECIVDPATKFVICQINLSSCQDALLEHSEPEWGWSSAYTNAFFKRDIGLIAMNCQGEQASRVVEMLRSGTHLLPTPHDFEYV